MTPESQSNPLYQNLDSSFVNLWALLRKLTKDGFVGRVRLELKDYVADVFVDGSGAPLVHEVDRAAGTDVFEQGALHRVVLRARESPGRISVFPSAYEAETSSASAKTEVTAPPAFEDAQIESLSPETEQSLRGGESAAQAGRDEITSVSADLIAGLTRAVHQSGADFAAAFNAARLELGDDYTFLDPMQNEFAYDGAVVTITQDLPTEIFVSGLIEALRRAVSRVATGEHARRVRERVALELALVARKRGEALKRTGFYDQLDRIAGTKVI